MTSLTDQQRSQVETAIFAGRKIEAIKIYREATGVQLVDAKRAVEDLEVDLRRRQPEMFINKSKGCMSVLVCGALLLGGLAVLVIQYLCS